ncbi:MAG: hypothetical protein AAF990_18865 [Bacteroidota bacterium]
MNRLSSSIRWVSLAFQGCFLSLIFLICLAGNAHAQTEGAPHKALGIEFQAYPTGIMPGLRFDLGLGAQSSVNLRLGLNILDHRDLGVQDDENGIGFGGSLGYRYHMSSNKAKWFGGIRADLWFNEVDWEDESGRDEALKGTTNIIVFQPTVEAGYIFSLGDKGWYFTPNLSFGFEINVKTDGEEVGEGAVLLVGFSFGKRF